MNDTAGVPEEVDDEFYGDVPDDIDDQDEIYPDDEDLF